MKVIVAGSRSTTLSKTVKEAVEEALFNIPEMVHGDCSGLDTFARDRRRSTIRSVRRHSTIGKKAEVAGSNSVVSTTGWHPVLSYNCWAAALFVVGLAAIPHFINTKRVAVALCFSFSIHVFVIVAVHPSICSFLALLKSFSVDIEKSYSFRRVPRIRCETSLSANRKTARGFQQSLFSLIHSSARTSHRSHNDSAGRKFATWMPYFTTSRTARLDRLAPLRSLLAHLFL